MRKIYTLFLACTTAFSFAQSTVNIIPTQSDKIDAGSELKLNINETPHINTAAKSISSYKTSATDETYWVNLVTGIGNVYGPTNLRIHRLWPDSLGKYRYANADDDTIITPAGRAEYQTAPNPGWAYYFFNGFYGMGQVFDPSSDIYNSALDPVIDPEETVGFSNQNEFTIDSVSTAYFYNRSVDSTQGAFATGTIMIANNNSISGDTISINDVDFIEGVNFNSGPTALATADSLNMAINDTSALAAIVTSSVSDSTVTITANTMGSSGNGITLSYGDAGSAPAAVTLSGSTLSGGQNSELIVDTLRVYILSPNVVGSASNGIEEINAPFIDYNNNTGVVAPSGIYHTEDILLTYTDTTKSTYNEGTAFSDVKEFAIGFPAITLTSNAVSAVGVFFEFLPGNSYENGDIIYDLGKTPPSTENGNSFHLVAFNEIAGGRVLGDHDDYITLNSSIFTSLPNVSATNNQDYMTAGTFFPTSQNPIHQLLTAWRVCPVGALYSYEVEPVGAVNCRTVEFENISNFDATSFQWNFGDGSATSSEENPTHTYETAGEYEVTLTATGSGRTLSFTTEVEVDFCTGIEENDLHANISLYPNPAQDVLKIEYNIENTQDLEISIVDLQGKVVYNNLVQRVNTFNNTIDISALSNGTYMIKFQNGNGVITEPITIAR